MDLEMIDNFYSKGESTELKLESVDATKVTVEKLNEVIENMKDESQYGKFYAQDGNVWVAVDNSTGNAWTEEFSSEENAKRWLKDTSLTPDDIEDGLNEDIENKPKILIEDNIVKVTLEQSINFNFEAEDDEEEIDEQEALEKIEIDDTEVSNELLDYLQSYSDEDEYKSVYNSVRRVIVDSSSYDKINCILELGSDFEDSILQDTFNNFISDVVLEDEQYSGFDSYNEHSTHTVYYDDWSDEVEDDYHKEVEFTFTVRTEGEQTIEISR